MKFLLRLSVSLFLLSVSYFLVFNHSAINGWLRAAGNIFSNLADRAKQNEFLKSLELKNRNLETELEALKKFSRVKTEPGRLLAKVYSRYPFNNRGLLIIDAGAEKGVKTGFAVLTKEGNFLGKVTKVNNFQSEITTIFDPSWRSSVAILGESRTKAAFIGGANPKLELIAKDAVLASGNKVVNISPEFPLNLPMGEITKITTKEAEVWLEAEISPFFNESISDEVLIITNFP